MLKFIATLALPALLAGCAAQSSTAPLVFGTATTLGVSVGSTAASAGTPEFTVGFRRAEIAVVPTIIPKNAITGQADNQEVRAFGADTAAGAGEIDALSTFGSFSGDTTTGSVNLGTFFATGLAAQNLSNGFKCQLAQGSHYDCTANADE